MGRFEVKRRSSRVSTGRIKVKRGMRSARETILNSLTSWCGSGDICIENYWLYMGKNTVDRHDNHLNMAWILSDKKKRF